MEKSTLWENLQLSPNGAAPMYAQLADFLRHNIQSGALKPSDRIIGENDLVQMLGVSRTTVRLAFDALLEEGLIVRYRGKGSFVAEPKLRRSINYLYNFTENIRAAGAIPSSKVLRCKLTEDPAEAIALNLTGGDRRVFLLERLRMANGEALIAERTCVPYYLCPGIEHHDFSAASLYALLRGQYGLNICRAEESIEAVVLHKETAALLECKPGLPGYRVERLAYLNSGYLCEHTVSYTRADRCTFRLDLYSNPQTREHTVDFQRKMHLPPKEGPVSDANHSER